MKAEVTIEGERFVFRVPDLQDLFVLDGAIPILEFTTDPTSVGAEEIGQKVAAIMKDPKRVVAMSQRIDRLLAQLSIEPKLVADDEVTKENMDNHVRTCIPQQYRAPLFSKLQALAGFDEVAALEVRPFSGNGSSGVLTASPSDTEAGRAATPEDGSTPSNV